MPVPWTVSWKPYMRVDFLQTCMNSRNVTMPGQTFLVATPGSAVQLGIGAAGMITPNLSMYGEVSGKQRLGHGFESIGATLGLRYTF
ncbi:autotransporter outer membrane beta-barrel domain-containing protein [Trinickia sp. EG282A]|uniref:autotransporter outer membrane beta-barrel domain-containing protein n=1 Tax=Trinickia sp. EG282A TaxID=3237013 RepID=UPI0034D22D6A